MFPFAYRLLNLPKLKPRQLRIAYNLKNLLPVPFHTMNNSDAYWFMLQFKLKIYQASGDEFQRLFNDVMTAVHGTNFQSVKPWGNTGDRGNDGFLVKDGHFFQVHAPSPTTQINGIKVASKAKNDFSKLKASQTNLKCYSFVLNDRFTAIPEAVHQVLTEIEKTHNIPSTAFNSGHLEQLFLSLNNNQKMSIVQSVPLETPGWVDPKMVSELLEYLSRSFTFSASLMTKKDTAPEFNQKIKFNNLNTGIAQYLRIYVNQISEVDAFLAARPGMAQVISEELNKIYTDSLSDIPNTENNAADLRFVYILECLLPPSARENPMQLRAWQQIALIVMAKYFETCNIYEHPSSSYSA